MNEREQREASKHEQERPDERGVVASNETEEQATPEAERQEPGPRIFAASLSDYNNGILYGEWLDADVEPEELQEGITAMLAYSPMAQLFGDPAEEWAIFDFEGFGPLRLGEYESSEWITRVAKGIAEHGPAFAAWASMVGDGESDRERLESFDEHYLGEWESVEDYAEQFLDDIGASEAIEKMDDWLQSYISVDVEGFARDLQLSGDITVVEKPDGGVWIFDSG